MKRSCKGGGPLSAAMMTLFITGFIAASVASLISFQRKAGINQQMKLHSMNAAEAAIDYAYAYVTNDANTNGIDASNYIPPVGGAPMPVNLAADALDFLKNKNPMPSSAGGGDPIEFTDIKVSVMPRLASGPVRVYIDPKNSANVNNPNRGQWVYQETITMVSSVTAIQGGIKQTSFARKDLNYNITNLFQHAIFFQGQLHLHRGFKVMGSVHTNGNLILNAHNGDHAIYNGFVNAGNRFYRGSITDNGGTGMDAYGLVPQLPNGDLTGFNIVPSGGGLSTTTTTTPLSGGDIPIYIDTPAPGQYVYRFVGPTTDSRSANWINESKDYNGHLEDITHSVPIINPIGSIGYAQDVASTTANEFSNGPYFLIEPVLPPSNPLRSSATTTKTNYRYNLSANAALVLRVEYAARINATGAAYPAGQNYMSKNPNDPSAAGAGAYWPMGDAGAADNPEVVAAGFSNGLPQAQNPANYVIRAYAKPANLTRVNDPNDQTQRVPIPFPTDVIGRADYARPENGAQANYNYAAGVAPMPVDVLGTEKTTAATANFPATVSKKDPDADQIKAESFHRYRFECYQPANTAANAVYGNPADWQNGSNTATVDALWGGGGDGDLVHTANVPAGREIAATATSGYNKFGLHDPRLGRGAHLLTLDIGRLREIMEEPLTTVKTKFGAEAEAFRLAFNNGNQQWNGIIYIEFPTSSEVEYDVSNPAASINRAPFGSVYYDVTNPSKDAPVAAIDQTPGRSYLDTFRFKYSAVAELRHPLRAANTDSRANRTDNVVPMAPEFRRYPSTVNSKTIANPFYAILALQVVNAKRLPRVNTTHFDATAGNALPSGLTLATNAPLYLIGSWNSDGNYTTGTNVASTNPNDYATTDTLTAANVNNPEIPSAIFCDTLTVLSPGWATQRNYPNAPAGGLTRRQNSYNGWSNNSDSNRRVTWQNANERIEISACIATGEFPVFEFFTHALEDFNLTNGTPCTPIVVKGAMVGMFTSEIQHIKQAYGRNPAKDIQTYWHAHGAHAFPSPRLHRFILDGNFPPGTPQALVPSQSNFQVIFKNDPLVSAAGF